MITVNLGKFTFTIRITNLYWKYLNTEFRFAERDIIPRLSEALQLPYKIVCCQETVANNIEALYKLLLKRLSYPCRLSHMVPAYPSSCLQAPFSRQNLTSSPGNFNKAMGQTRVPVEWNRNLLQVRILYEHLLIFQLPLT